MNKKIDIKATSEKINLAIIGKTMYDIFTRKIIRPPYLLIRYAYNTKSGLMISFILLLVLLSLFIWLVAGNVFWISLFLMFIWFVSLIAMFCHHDDNYFRTLDTEPKWVLKFIKSLTQMKEDIITTDKERE